MHRFTLSGLSLFIIEILLITGCNSNEIGNGKDVNPESIYFDYKIWGEEGNENITVMLQFRFAGSNGTTLLLEEPAKVELDGASLKADSSFMNGAYYEVIRPVESFTGPHAITYTDINGKKFIEKFSFHPLAFRQPLPRETERNDLVFELSGLDTVDFVRILLIDTSFESSAVNRLDTVWNGKIVIKREWLNSLATGPVRIELYREMERPVKEGTREGGRIAITYGLKSEFLLKESSRP